MRVVVLVGAVALALTGCSALPTVGAFPPGGVADYQLGGAYPPPEGVTIVARDSTSDPVPGLYSICYINGFQTQPGAGWPDDLVLRDGNGDRLVDPNWPDENILDISTAANRTAVLARLDPVIASCAAKGFAAVEFDNLDSYTRSDGALAQSDAIAFATQLVAAAHARGLAAAQKNTGELGTEGRDVIGFDFAVVEECARYDECDMYTDVYGTLVIDIEYADDLPRPFTEVCADARTPVTTTLRDRGLAPAGSSDYVFAHC
ncbi:endo alpha-1,4 polygalactosaminidase [soil metagenome]